MLAGNIDSVSGQQIEPVQVWIEQLSPRERIAQLMIIPVTGRESIDSGTFHDLVVNYGIGGVIIQNSPETEPFEPVTAATLREFLSSLQALVLMPSDNDLTGLPLITAMPLTTADGSVLRLVQDSSSLPSPMTMGATWQPTIAAQVGEQIGQEAKSLGINLLIGPNASLYNPEQIGNRTLETSQFFGSHPYWIEQFIEQFVRGVRNGSTGRVAIVLSQFPGTGSSDRNTDFEIPVIPAPIQELIVRDFAPYWHLLGLQDTNAPLIDGVQCVSIRYYPSPGVIGQPTCLDESAFAGLIGLEPVASWHTDGGIIVSPPLGTQAVRRWYDGAVFPHRQIARDTLLAGSDMLLLETFGTTMEADATNNIIDTMEFLTELYLTDTNFRARIDASLARVVALKLKLYVDDFSSANIAVPSGENTAPLAVVNPNHSSYQAVTLIAPLPEQIAPAPGLEADILLLTDQTPIRACSTCTSEPPLSVTDIQEMVNSLYGGSGQVNPDRIRSYTLNNLEITLNLSTSTSDVTAFDTEQRLRLTREIENSEYIVLAVYSSKGVGTAQAFLSSYIAPAGKYIVIMDFGSPDILTATDIAKLAGYYALYSPIEPAVDAAVRALFHEAVINGRSPINIPAVNYDIERVTQPDPAQTIQFIINERPIEDITNVGDYTVGQLLRIQTNTILDRNGHIVPDGTFVILELNSEDSLITQQSQTQNGKASFEITPQQTGSFTLTMAVGEARSNVAGRIIETIAVTESAVPEGSETTLVIGTAGQNNRRVQLNDLLLVIGAVGLLAGMTYGTSWIATHSHEASLRLLLGVVIGGYLAYIYFGLGLPGSDVVAVVLPNNAVIVLSLLGSILGLTYTWWSTLKTRH